MERRKLAPPYTYGEDIKLSQVRVGDVFSIEPPRESHRPSRSGTITKIKKINFDYDSVYAPSPTFQQTLHLRAPLTDIVGGFVVRGETVHVIVTG
jgi:hypothetical protein